MEALAQKAPRSPYLKTSYSEDMVLSAFDSPFRKKWTVVGIVILLVFPFIAGNYVIHIANLIAIAIVGALALNLLCGNAGLLSLGHAGFLAAGAFTTAIMSTDFGLPVWMVLPTAGLVGAVLGVIAGLPALRLKGIYLGISTLAIHYIIMYFLSEYQFHGGFGFSIKIADPVLAGFTLTGERRWYFALCAVALASGIFIRNLLRTRPGRAWTAIHNRDIAAEVMGINIGYYKVLAFAVSTSITSVAGSIYAYYTNSASVAEYSFGLTISYLAMIIVGGLGSVLGSILGAFLITLVPFILMYMVDFFNISGPLKEYFFAVQSGTFGLIIIIFLLMEPLGLAEIWRRTRDYFVLWPFRYKPLTITRR